MTTGRASTSPDDWVPHEQRWRECTGHMEREEGRLQLRVPLQSGEGVCSVPFAEDADAVTVLILVCGEADDGSDWIDCPVHIYLDEPLGNRMVRDLTQARRLVPYFNVYEMLEREFEPVNGRRDPPPAA